MSKKKIERDFSKEVKKLAKELSIVPEMTEEELQGKQKEFEEMHTVMNNFINVIALEEISSKGKHAVDVWYDMLNSLTMHIMVRTDKAFVDDVLGQTVKNLDMLEDWNNSMLDAGHLEGLTKDEYDARVENMNDKLTKH